MNNSVAYPLDPYWEVDIQGEMKAFFRPTLELHFNPNEQQSGELPTTIADAYKVGFDRASEFPKEMLKVALLFCDAFVARLTDAGFRIGWHFIPGVLALKSGTLVGPGVAVYLKRKRAEDGSEDLLGEREAIALGNAMNFVRNGVKVCITKLQVGIASGGLIQEAVLAIERGEDRLLSEQLGLGKQLGGRAVGELQQLCARLESVQKEWRWGFTEEEQLRWQQQLDRLKNMVKRRIKMAEVQDDSELWKITQEEIENAFPAFERKDEEEKWEIFRRIRVRLGLVDDE